jgi:penicillin-binding protein 1A
MTIKHTPKAKPSFREKLRLFLWGDFRRKFLTLFSGLVFFLLIFTVYFGKDLPSFEQLENYSPELATKVYSADGVMIKEFFTERRFYTPLSQIPDTLVQAVLATEDHRFYEHWGISPTRLLKVIFTDIVTMSKQQGASTLTQQLARRLYLTPEKTIIRKIKEILTAIQIERTYTKPEILEMYMNLMSFGHGTYGVESAARHFFAKNVQDLTLSEAALLTGMLQRPATLNPFRYPERALNRRNVVLARMRAEGFITEKQFQTASNKNLDIVNPQGNALLGVAPYFTEYLRQNLQKDYGMDLYQEGFKVYTSLDTRLQAIAEAAVDSFLPNLQAVVSRNMRKKSEFARLVPPSLLRDNSLDELMQNKTFVDSLIQAKAPVQVMLVALDPSTGHLLAMIGGRDFNESQFNRAVQAIRQPGSVFKPIVYTAAIDNGYMPTYEKLNQPIVVHMPDGSRWTPHNYDGSIGGKTTLREALRKSLNLVSARLVQEDVPPEQVIRYARNLGITTHLDPVDALALGSCGVIPMEMVSAFGVFANNGVLVKPVSVLRVEDKNGNILERAKQQSKGVLREETAYIMTDLLKTVASRGTGAASRSVYRFLRPAGGKTGTTNNFTDAWYVTFTPQIVAGVWVGLDDPSLSLGNRQSGARAALPIAATFMAAAHDTLQLPVAEFIKPDGVVELEICAETKMLASDYCPEVESEIFAVRYQPTRECEYHSGHQSINRPELSEREKKRRLRY